MRRLEFGEMVRALIVTCRRYHDHADFPSRVRAICLDAIAVYVCPDCGAELPPSHRDPDTFCDECGAVGNRGRREGIVEA